MQYPLIFPHGTDGWNFNLKLANGKKIDSLGILPLPYHGTAKYLSVVESSASIPIILGRFILQIETERLQFLRCDQIALRADCYQDLRDSIIDRDGDPSNVGRRIILPLTFTGGPRYMHERQQDALTYVRKFGSPDLFHCAKIKFPEIHYIPNYDISL